MQPTATLRMFRPSRRMMAAQPNEEHRAHTISQRLRALRKIPPELIPLGIVVGVAVGFAGYSLARKLVVDKTMRLGRQNRKD
ncbi:uncharacterized protein L3040_006974 [Drepanopeziza brunnea f. sp. 'multigermtubi']|uniref:NADH-ubiquinone reductase complex 1 MLRQ subunit n=1 Tax=Marssonina brunnea f. sp. multigermtubi (strain MB_m1) TaxID=1072389 RepID=K1W6Z9_MARBU|nr:uncharacterized protein MBM_09049 [Drepanopeziza brunnea f. sp. 'multigermtubi' MB_m1]EKD12820.1 hypothetical protein MBM_09049 [Drepanopeziza brunnea f. sp. 'multigermtubi' MB_m1]KAJ5038105.1 hypothetical protein L3040_006974 [Drepanopeziza brunnea f. sp. 'multigermtubi']